MKNLRFAAMRGEKARTEKSGRLSAIKASAALLCLCLLFTSCGGAPSEQAVAAEASSDSNGSFYEEAGFDDGISYDGAEYVSEDMAGSVPVMENQKIIYTAYLEIETASFEENRQNILEKLEECGGYVESSSTSGGLNSDGTSRRRYARLTLRVPADRYNEFLNAEGFGNVVQRNEDTEEITTAYADVEARLASLEAQRTRLLELTGEAGSLEELLAVEQRLSEVVYEIESYSSQKKLYDSRLSYCTVEISLSEVVRTTSRTDTFGGRVSAALVGSWEAFVGFLQDAVVFIIYSAPAIIAVGVIAAAAVAVIKKRRSRRAMSQAAPNSPGEGSETRKEG